MKDMFHIGGRRDPKSGEFILDVGLGWGIAYGLVMGACFAAWILFS